VVVFFAGDEVECFQVGEDLFAGGSGEFEADVAIFFALEFALAVFVYFAVGGEQINLFEVVALAGGVVVGVVGGGDFDDAGAEFGVDEFSVGDDGDFAADEGDSYEFTMQMFITWIVWMHSDGGVA